MGTSESEFRRLAAIETDECVIWPYARAGQRRYGQVYVDRMKKYAHREALRLRIPEPSGGAVTRHGPCNQPACMNYRHLSWGTQIDNVADMRRDGTAKIGEQNPRSVLTDDVVRQMRHLYLVDRVPQRKLAVSFGVAVMTVNRVIRGESWSHVA